MSDFQGWPGCLEDAHSFSPSLGPEDTTPWLWLHSAPGTHEVLGRLVDAHLCLPPWDLYMHQHTQRFRIWILELNSAKPAYKLADGAAAA